MKGKQAETKKKSQKPLTAKTSICTFESRKVQLLKPGKRNLHFRKLMGQDPTEIVLHQLKNDGFTNICRCTSGTRSLRDGILARSERQFSELCAPDLGGGAHQCVQVCEYSKEYLVVDNWVHEHHFLKKRHQM